MTHSCGKHMLVTITCCVVQSGFSRKDSIMSLDMRLLAVSKETEGSDSSVNMTVGLSDTPVKTGRRAQLIAPRT